MHATGATVPAWSTDGKSLLYIARNGIWLLPHVSGQPVRTATPLYQPGNGPAYFGQAGWSAQVAWRPR